MITLKCPHCNKEITMTVEELMSSGGNVVCPQCLHVFVPAGVELPCAPAPMSEVASGSAPAGAPHVLFCHCCGERLPAADLRFCPYCGTGLFSAPVASAAVGEPVSARSPEPAKPEAVTPSATAKAGKVDNSHHGLNNLPLIRSFNRPASREDIMGTSLTRLLCYAIIAVLAFIFVRLIWLIVEQGG